MLEQILRAINDFFVVETRSVTAIGQNTITVDNAAELRVGQYVYLHQSKLNDGLYRIIEKTGNALTLDITEDLQEEDADDAILHGLAIPKAILELQTEIEAYNTGNPSNLVSETLGDYSATRASGTKGDASWRASFASRLNPYRKVYLNLPRRSKKWL